MRNENLLNGVIIGFGLHASIMCLFQDMFGKDEYIKYIGEHWVNLHPVVSVVMICFYIFVYHMLLKKDVYLD